MKRNKIDYDVDKRWERQQADRKFAAAEIDEACKEVCMVCGCPFECYADDFSMTCDPCKREAEIDDAITPEEFGRETGECGECGRTLAATEREAGVCCRCTDEEV